MTTTVTCPACKGQSVYSTTNPWRPFCSQRCQQMDLGAWASEHFVLSESVSTDNPLPDDRLPA